MSGIEVAGLALAILPLVVSTAKRYDSALSPYLRYRRFAKEAKLYSKGLEIQRTIFRNECRNLLERVIDHDTASGMLNLLSQEPWSDAHLDAQLVQQLGESWKACVAIIELIEGQLSEVEVENQGFGAIVDQELIENQVLIALSRRGAAFESLFADSQYPGDPKAYEIERLEA